MRRLLCMPLLFCVASSACSATTDGDAAQAADELTTGTRASLDSNEVLVIDGKKIFPLGVTMPPPPGTTAPNGRDAFEEMHAGGLSFVRTGTMAEPWSPT